MRRLRPLFLCASLALALGVGLPSPAHAASTIAASYDGLLDRADLIVVAEAAEQHAAWEGTRIYTYTRVQIAQTVAGNAPSDSIWIRTLGGVVGKIGHHVDGEAVLIEGKSSLLFLREGPRGTYEVTARGQGQYPVLVDTASQLRVTRSAASHFLFLPIVRAPMAAPTLAVDVLGGRALRDVVRTVGSDWSQRRAAK